MLDELRAVQAQLKILRKQIAIDAKEFVSKQDLRDQAESIATTWFSELSPQLRDDGPVQAATIDAYDKHFKRVIKLASGTNRSKTYLSSVDLILKRFRDELVLPVQTRPKVTAAPSELGKLIATIPDPAENDYLREAVKCVQHGLFRAAAILGWCAAIDRIHRQIDVIGLDQFSSTSSKISSQQSGRFKKFNKSFKVQSVSELRMVFDSDVLWVLEGMGLIDVNQHTRLRACFDLRNQCAHPGDAPITEYNLLSFFSDLIGIVFTSPAFQDHG